MPTKQIVVREIPVDLWKRLKLHAVDKNQTIQTTLVQAIEAFLQRAA